MIWTVTANPALDITYRVGTFHVGGVSRVRDLSERAGGKGLNVARVLDALGHPVTATGFLGGSDGERVTSLLAAGNPGVTARFVQAAGPTRRSVAIVDDDAATSVLNEQGPPRSASEWEDLFGVLAEVGKADVVAISGSLPPDSDPELLPRMVRFLKERGARVLVDTSGPALLTAADAGADLLKPNNHELLEATGANDLMDGVRELLWRGAGVVALSLGEDGMLAAARTDERLRTAQARPRRTVVGNPTGAGDASVAAWCAWFAERPDAAPADLVGGVGEAVALSAAAVASPVAGEFDSDEWAAQRGPEVEESTHDW
ncbi:MAG: 1-phosphofructokinase family hexose kinase [bacterium]|nr:1-phosphofructokinase family hexose kinase [bacterium]